MFDRLTLKPVRESHLRRGTFLPNFSTLGLWVLELFAMYATGGRTDRQTDGRTDGQKQRLLPPSLRGRRHNNEYMCVCVCSLWARPVCWLSLYIRPSIRPGRMYSLRLLTTLPGQFHAVFLDYTQSTLHTVSKKTGPPRLI